MQRSHRRQLSLLLLFSTALSSTFVAGQSSSRSTNPDDQELLRLERRMDSATPAEAAVLVSRAYALREYVDDRAGLETFLAAVAGDARQHPLVRDEAQYRLAQIDLHNGKLEASAERYAALGFVREWSIVAPFGASDGLDGDAVPPTGQLRPTKTISSARPWIDLGTVYVNTRTATAFAATSLYSNQSRVVALRFSSDAAFTLAVNGRRVFVRSEAATLAFDQHAVAAQLRAGWNTVVLKFSLAAGEPWGFGLRVTGLSGGGVRLRMSVTQAWVTAESAAVVPPASPADLAEIGRAAVDVKSSADRWETLARVERERGRGSALESMEHAVALAPNPERFLAIAEMSGRADERFAALVRALQLNPNFVPAQLELAAYYTRRGQLEKARDLLKAVRRVSPQDFVAEIQLADLYARAGLNSLALATYEQLASQFPRPLWLKRELAERFQGYNLLDRARELAQAALREDFDNPDARALMENIAERQHDVATLRSSYLEALRLDPQDTPVLSRLAMLKAGSGDFAGAEASLREALGIDPADAALHRRLGEVLASAGQAQLSQGEFDQALALNPKNEDLRRRLQADRSSQDPDHPYLVNAADLADTARREGARESEDAILLADIRVRRVFENGQASVRTQQVTYIATEEGARARGIASVQYSPAAEDLRVLHARVYRADGRVTEGDQAGDSPVTDASRAMYYDVRSRAIRFRDLQKGDVIELDYRLTPAVAVNPYGDYFSELVVFGAETRLQLQRYVLITAASRKFYVHEERVPTAAKITTESNQRVYRWEARNLPTLATEPRGPALIETAPYVHVSTFASWQELGRWYAELIRPQFKLDGKLREALAAVLAGQHSDEDKIRAIHRFVVRNTHYVALEFGVYSYKPYPVSETYARRFGDCKDKASLMIALLRAAGIEADIALIRTRRLGPINDTPASISIFNHAIVQVPRYDLWLDGTAEYAGLHELPLDDQGALALTVAADGRAELRQVPTSTAADNYTRRVIQAQVGSDGLIRFSGSASIRGEDAPGLRRDFEVSERQRDSFRERLAEVFPTVHVDAVSVQGAHDLDRDVTVEFRGVLDTFAGRKTLSLAASWMPRAYIERLAPVATRDQDLVLPAPWTTEEELRFLLPEGARFSFLPTSWQIDTSFGAASLEYKQVNNELIVRTIVRFRSTRIDPHDYPAFRQFCAELERVFRREAKVELP